MSSALGFTVLYSWRLHAGKEHSFIDAWSRVTQGMLTRHGALGSRLHRGAGDIWYAYAQWESAQAREAAFALPPIDPEAMLQMQEAIAERFPELVLEPVADYLVFPVRIGA